MQQLQELLQHQTLHKARSAAEANTLTHLPGAILLFPTKVEEKSVTKQSRYLN